MRIDRRRLLAGAVIAPLLPITHPAAAQDGQSDRPWIILAGDESGPRGRWDHNLVYDGWNNRLLLAGGRDESGTVRGDCWSFDLASYTWSELNLSGPKARFGSAAALSPDGSGFYYFGGQSGNVVFGDLWWFDFATTTWQPVEPELGPAPPARTGARGVVDTLGRLVVSHGCNGETRYDDTWAFDPSTGEWSDISPPADQRPMARCDHAMTVLPGTGEILLAFGCSGEAGLCPRDDHWVFDPVNRSWTELTPLMATSVNIDTDPDPLPPARTGAAMTTLGDTVLLVGGSTALGPSSDVWTGSLQENGFVWLELTYVNHGPEGIYRRFGHDLVTGNSQFYLFGGEGIEGPLSDLWSFSLDRFRNLEQSDQEVESA